MWRKEIMFLKEKTLLLNSLPYVVGMKISVNSRNKHLYGNMNIHCDILQNERVKKHLCCRAQVNCWLISIKRICWEALWTAEHPGFTCSCARAPRTGHWGGKPLEPVGQWPHLIQPQQRSVSWATQFTFYSTLLCWEKGRFVLSQN